MKIEQLNKSGIPREFIQIFREKEGIIHLFPPQEKAIKKGLLRRRNLGIFCPTASGKTFIATLAIINNLQKSLGKVVYIVPLVAIANEKYSYYKQLLNKYKIAISVGELDSADPWLIDYDLIVVTSEKLDSLIRHSAGWIKDISLVIADEIHLINDPSRGPTLEVLLTQLKRLVPNAQILALSATVSNAKELADWLDADTVVDDFRPVRLYEGVCFDCQIGFLNKDGWELADSDSISGIVKHTLGLKKQALFFVSTRRSCESLAERLTGVIKDYLGKDEFAQLESLSQTALNCLEVPTRQCRRLSLCIKQGVAFHHAGLMGKQKRLIEDNFRKGLIKFIVATPTLAMGVNLPAFRVIIRDAKRYYPGRGSEFIPVLEYKQFCGRAGRPQYDDFGESILLAKDEEEAEELIEHYIKGKPERIESKLFSEPSLRHHILALIASEFVDCKDSLFDFLKDTFFGFQYQDVRYLEGKIENILDAFFKWDFIKSQRPKFKASPLGKRVSQLYLDPLTAHNFIESIKHSHLIEDFCSFSIIQVISYNSEIAPLPRVKPREEKEFNSIIKQRQGQFLSSVPSVWDEGWDDFLASVKLALIFEAWTEEATEEKILEEFGMAPGELSNKLSIADWLLFSLGELARILKETGIASQIREVRVRLQYGVRQELLDLVSLREIGRVRSRRLFNAGIKNIAIFKRTPVSKLIALLGPKITQTVLEQIKKEARYA